MSQSARKIIKKRKRTIISAEKVDLQFNEAEEQILTIIRSLVTIEKNIQQETYDDSQYLNSKYQKSLQQMLEKYKEISKKIDRIQCRSILNN